MTNEDRIRALEKIAQSGEGHKAFLEGQAKAHGDYAKSRAESADSLSGWGNTVGVVGGGTGGAMTLKGLKQMLDKGPKIVPAGVESVYAPGNPHAGVQTLSPVEFKPTGALVASAPNSAAIVKRPTIPPGLRGKRLVLKGGILGLGSLGISAALHGMASSNREKANEHTKSLHEISSTLKGL